MARIVEMCYFTPVFKPLPPMESPTDDAASEHTLTDTLAPAKSGEDDEKTNKRAASEIWRHLPPFVRLDPSRSLHFSKVL